MEASKGYYWRDGDISSNIATPKDIPTIPRSIDIFQLHKTTTVHRNIHRVGSANEKLYSESNRVKELNGPIDNHDVWQNHSYPKENGIVYEDEGFGERLPSLETERERELEQEQEKGRARELENEKVSKKNEKAENAYIQEAVDASPMSIPIPEAGVEEMKDIIHPSTYVFIFANPRSGNRQGEFLVNNLNIQHFRLKSHPRVQVQIYNILSEMEKSQAISYIRYLLLVPPPDCPEAVSQHKHVKELHILSAGGDGTFMAVLECVAEAGIDVEDKRVLFSAIPLGTGNDLSQMLGWGKSIPMRDFEGKERLEKIDKLVMDRIVGMKAKLDIWDVNVECRPNSGFISHVVDLKCAPCMEASRHMTSFHRTMSNYMSIGVQGWVGSEFEKHRRGSRAANAMEYARQSAKVFFSRIPPITNSIESLWHGDLKVVSADEYDSVSATCAGPLKPMSRLNKYPPVELILQNIAALWGRNIDLWGTTPIRESIVLHPTGPTDFHNWTPQRANDGKLEIFGIGTLWEYLKKQFAIGRKDLRRIGQFPTPIRLQFFPQASTRMMIDGEFYELYDVDYIDLKRKYQITVVGPADPEKSRLVRDQIESEKEMGRSLTGLWTRHMRTDTNDTVVLRNNHDELSTTSTPPSTESSTIV